VKSTQLLATLRVLGRHLVVLGTLAVCVFLSPHTTRAQRSIPDDNLAYPVFVQFPDEQASGFYLNSNNSIYLVTAKHVLFSPATGLLHPGLMVLLSYLRDPKQVGTNVLTVDLGALSQAGEVKAHPIADVAVVRIGDVVKIPDQAAAPPPNNGYSSYAIHFLPGVTVSALSPDGGLLSVALDTIKKYDDVLVANDVLVFGYPTSLGIKESPQLDPLRPLLRRGIVAGLNPGAKSIVIDCPSYPGNSGGPVVEADRQAFSARFSIIGVVSGFVPFEEKSINYPIEYQNISIANSGYTVVTPMDFVLELTK
jgi:Trypsin-like peptidase domain